MKKIIIAITLVLTLQSFSQNKKYCKKIEVTINKFEQDTTYSTPTNGAKGWVNFSKRNNKIFMGLKVFNTNFFASQKGVDVLLEDGSKISKPNAKITSNVITAGGRAGHLYISIVELSEEEVQLLIDSPITDYRLYLYEGKPVSKYAKKDYREYLKCLKR